MLCFCVGMWCWRYWCGVDQLILLLCVCWLVWQDECISGLDVMFLKFIFLFFLVNQVKVFGCMKCCIGRWLCDGCRYWLRVSMLMLCLCICCMISMILLLVLFRLSISLDLVGMCGIICLNFCSRFSDYLKFEFGCEEWYRCGIVFRLWLNMFGGLLVVIFRVMFM